MRRNATNTQTIRWVSRAGVIALIAAIGLSTALGLLKAQAQDAAGPVEFTAVQSAAGKSAYDLACASCHGSSLDNGQFGPPLRGEGFDQAWAGGTVDELFGYISSNMPPAGPGRLGEATNLAITAYIMESNGIAPGPREMPADRAALAGMRIPGAGQ